MIAALDDLHQRKFVFESVKPPGEAFCSEMGHLHAFRGAESASKRAACHTQQNTDEDTHAHTYICTHTHRHSESILSSYIKEPVFPSSFMFERAAGAYLSVWNSPAVVRHS